MNHRENVTHEKEEQGCHGYSNSGELVSAVRKRNANESVRPDWSHGYQYRDNGNRASISTPEGETLNYTFSNVSSGVNVGLSPSPTKQWLRGRAHPDAEVKVGTGTAEREGDLWRYLWTNPAPPAAQQVTVTATRPSLTPGPIPGSQSWTLPAAATLYQYDLRGNLSQDAHWLYTWDAENRLVVQEQKYPGTATDGAREVKRLEFSYDAMGRRLSKKLLVSQKLSNGQLVGTWSFSKETVFIWQDWVLLAEFVKTRSGGNFELRRSYLWGLDVDGRLGGAGGVGGLLWVADYVPGQATSNRQLAPWYDGNGNVMGWMENDGAQPLPQHRLEYDPYGKLLVDDTVRPTRNQKQRNLGVSEEWLDRPAFAFSTKYEDAETGLLYYGYRYYAPDMGRWISLDPIWEHGELNLYGMCGSDPVNRWDKLGMLDQRTENNIATLHPKLQPLARAHLTTLSGSMKREAAKRGQSSIYLPKIIQAHRTYAEQDALYNQGRNGNPGKIVTNAKGGQSNHNFRLAYDIAFFCGNTVRYDGWEFDVAGRIGKAYGLKWGGDWTNPVDRPHFEYPHGMTMKELREESSNGLNLVEVPENPANNPIRN